jgi:hypothetical protein
MINAWAASFRVLIACGLAFMVLGCASGSGQGPAPALASGIVGRTMVGPECPVFQAASPCPDRPLRARLVVTAEGSTEPVATVVTDGAGHFHIPLAPGRYTVQPGNLTGAALPAARPVTVTVVTSRFTDLTISFDSGIR